MQFGLVDLLTRWFQSIWAWLILRSISLQTTKTIWLCKHYPGHPCLAAGSMSIDLLAEFLFTTLCSSTAKATGKNCEHLLPMYISLPCVINLCGMQERQHGNMNRNFSNSSSRRGDDIYDVNVNNRNNNSSCSSTSSLYSSISHGDIAPDHGYGRRPRPHGSHDHRYYGSMEKSRSCTSRGIARIDSGHQKSLSVGRKPRYSLDDR